MRILKNNAIHCRFYYDDNEKEREVKKKKIHIAKEFLLLVLLLLPLIVLVVYAMFPFWFGKYFTGWNVSMVCILVRGRTHTGCLLQIFRIECIFVCHVYVREFSFEFIVSFSFRLCIQCVACVCLTPAYKVLFATPWSFTCTVFFFLFFFSSTLTMIWQANIIWMSAVEFYRRCSTEHLKVILIIFIQSKTKRMKEKKKLCVCLSHSKYNYINYFTLK